MADRTSETSAPLNVSGPGTTKRRKRAPGPRKDTVVLAELQLLNPDGSEFEVPAGTKAVATNVSKDLAKWAMSIAEGKTASALTVVVRIPSSGAPTPNAPNGS